MDQYADANWRLWNLYKIINDSGRKLNFVPNTTQLKFFNEMWYRNVISKGRQLGFTTGLCIFILDACVFVPNTNAGIIAHTLDDVKKIFRRKIRYPYENLPAAIREAVSPTNDTQNELIFSNNSEIGVDTSMRSGTLNYLLISEYGKIAQMYPERAAEIKTGSFNTVHPGNYLFVESTGHGKGGAYYDLIKQSRDLAAGGKPLSKLDFKYHFYAWWMKPGNVLDDEETSNVVITRKDDDYFNKVERAKGCKLSLNQRAWYVVTKRYNGDEMKREHPSTDNEPFEAVLRGAIFGDQMQEAREQGRIKSVPHDPGLSVDTWWDIGRRDKTAIWFVQTIGRELRFIWYHEESFRDLPYFCALLNTWRIEKKWNYRHHLGPNDMRVTEFGTGVPRFEQALKFGFNFQIGQQYRQEDQINTTRAMLPMCYFDEVNCAEGITHLDQVRREWSEHLQQYMESYLHNEHSHGASSLMNGACMLGMLQRGQPRARAVENKKFAT